MQSSLDSSKPASEEGDPQGGPKYRGGSVHASQSVDLSDVQSVQKYAQSFLQSNDRLDILICNAGLVPPKFTRAAKPEVEGRLHDRDRHRSKI